MEQQFSVGHTVCPRRVRRLNLRFCLKELMNDLTTLNEQIRWCRECCIERLMVTHDIEWRCDRWEPRVRPEPTSTVHAQRGKLRPEGLAGITGAVCIIWYQLVHSIILVTGIFFVWLPVYDPTPPGLDSALVVPLCLLCYDLLVMPCYLYVIILIYLE